MQLIIRDLIYRSPLKTICSDTNKSVSMNNQIANQRYLPLDAAKGMCITLVVINYMFFLIRKVGVDGQYHFWGIREVL